MGKSKVQSEQNIKVFFIPSWYPTSDNPLSGIFIKEHALGLANAFPGFQIGISLWGSHQKSLLLKAKSWYNVPFNLLTAGKKSGFQKLFPNCTEYFTPAFTWTRKIWRGNMNGIVKANENNLLQFIAQHGKPDIIHAYVAHPAGYIAMELNKKYKIPYVITEEMSPFPLPDYGKPGQLSDWLYTAYRHSSANIAVSKSLYQKMEKEEVRNLVVIPNFIDEDYFSPSSFQAKPARRFLFIGRLEHQKGVDILLKAFSNLIQKGFLDVQLWIGGDGSEFKLLKQFEGTLKLKGNIKWLGALSRIQVKQNLQDCDAFVLPSRHESFGIVVAEAHAMGKPVIATRCGGPEEIITPENGLLVDPGNAGQLSAAMAQFISGARTYDPQAIRKSCLERFSKKVVTGKIVNLYQEVISNYPRKLNTTFPHPQPPSSV